MADDLQFKDFGSHVVNVKEDRSNAGETLYSFDHGESPPAGGSLQQGLQERTSNFFTWKCYQQYFDVDTSDVVNRLVYSMVPRPGNNFILDHLRPKPDLYGPVWICITLVFAIAVTGNLSSYLATAGGGAGDYHAAYDFGMVTASAGTIVGYVSLVPLVLYGLIHWKGSDVPFDFVDILSCYGYSMTSYLVAVLLWVFPWNWFQWAVLCVAAFLSSMVLVFAFWSNLGNQSKAVRLLSLTVLVICHVGLAIIVKVFFFRYSLSEGVLPFGGGNESLATAAALPVAPRNASI